MGAASSARAFARRDGGGNGLLRRPRTGEKILERRARGEKSERIALDLRLVLADVTDFLKRKRAAGDPRALNTKEAAIVARLNALRAIGAIGTCAPAAPALPAEPPAPPPAPEPEPVQMIRVRRIYAPAINPDGLFEYVARLRTVAGRVASAHPDAAAGYHHLADLHELCPTVYPSYVEPSEGATLASTNARFPRFLAGAAGGASLGGGASLSCLDA